MSDSSEWTVATVRVFLVKPHPNADKLDLITVGTDTEWSYTVIDQKGREVGDIVTYVSVDSLVPLQDDRWAFLRARAVGKSRYRIRAMSLRGVKSQGIITGHVDGTSVGDDVSLQLDIEKYLNPDEAVFSPTPKKRVGFFRKLLGRLFRSATDRLDERIPEYSVLNLRKVNPFSEGEQVVYTEKIHGTNVRFGKVNGKLVVGSHRRIVSDNRNWLDKLLKRSPPGGGFYGGNLYQDVVESIVKVEDLPEGIVYYGEIYGLTPNGKKIQDMTYGQLGPAMVIFPSCFYLKTGKWRFVDLRPCSMVPFLFPGTGVFDRQRVETEAEDPSKLDYGLREGLVIHSLDRPGVAAKYVSHKYMERKVNE